MYKNALFLFKNCPALGAPPPAENALATPLFGCLVCFGLFHPLSRVSNVGVCHVFKKEGGGKLFC